MSKPEDSIGLASSDWALCKMYLDDFEKSGRTAWETWEIELRGWEPSKPDTAPSPQAIAKLRAHYRASD